jgi:hypothetical protein
VGAMNHTEETPQNPENETRYLSRNRSVGSYKLTEYFLWHTSGSPKGWNRFKNGMLIKSITYLQRHPLADFLEASAFLRTTD